MQILTDFCRNQSCDRHVFLNQFSYFGRTDIKVRIIRFNIDSSIKSNDLEFFEKFLSILPFWNIQGNIRSANQTDILEWMFVLKFTKNIISIGSSVHLSLDIRDKNLSI